MNQKWCEELNMWVADIDDEGENFLGCTQVCDECVYCVGFDD